MGNSGGTAEMYFRPEVDPQGFFIYITLKGEISYDQRTAEGL